MFEQFFDAKLHLKEINDLFFLFLTSVELILNAQDHP
jgi:hypothetical protein